MTTEIEKVEYLAIYETGNFVVKSSFDEIRNLPGQPHLFKRVIKKADPFSLVCYDATANVSTCLLGRYEFIGVRYFNSSRPYQFKFYDHKTDYILEVAEVGPNNFEKRFAGAIRLVKESLKFDSYDEYEQFREFQKDRVNQTNLRAEVDKLKEVVTKLGKQIEDLQRNLSQSLANCKIPNTDE